MLAVARSSLLGKHVPLGTASSSSLVGYVKPCCKAASSPLNVGLSNRSFLLSQACTRTSYRQLHSSRISSTPELYNFDRPPTNKLQKSSTTVPGSSKGPSSLDSDDSSEKSKRIVAHTFKRRANRPVSKLAEARSTSPKKKPQFEYYDIESIRRDSEEIVRKPVEQTKGFSEYVVKLDPQYRRAKARFDPAVAERKHKRILDRILPTVNIYGFQSKYGASSLAAKAAVRPLAATDPDQLQRAKLLSDQLQLPFYETTSSIRRAGDIEFALLVGPDQIGLSNLTEFDAPTVFADFIGGATAFRKESGGADRKSPIMRAVRVNGKTPDETHLVDATGGLGVDAFMFASAGYKVTVLEKNPLVFTLLSDAYQRAQQVPKLKPILERMSLVHVDALDWFKQNSNTENAPDVIYLDPMYPIESKMKATPKKGMALARALVGRIDRADELVKAAVACSKEKTVLKRPYYATASIGTLTHFKSRSVRFEVFTSESWSSVGAPDIERVPATSTRRLLSL